MRSRTNRLQRAPPRSFSFMPQASGAGSLSRNISSREAPSHFLLCCSMVLPRPADASELPHATDEGLPSSGLVPLVFWSFGPLVFWSFGPLVFWSFGPLVSCCPLP